MSTDKKNYNEGSLIGGTISLLSSSQEQIWFATEMFPDTTAYSMFLKCKVRGHIDVAAMRTALNTLYDRHEQLRVSMRITQGKVLQCVLPTSEPPIRVIEYHTHPQTLIDVEAILTEETQAGFSLEQGKLFKACIIVPQQDEAILVLSMHHICADSWSLGILLREFIKLYADIIHLRDFTLPPLPASYFDYVVWQQQYRASEQATKDRVWWKNTLEGVPHRVAFPLAPRNNVADEHQLGERIVFKFMSSDLNMLKQIASEQQCTLYAVLLSLLNVLLYRYTGQDDFVIGVPLANRPKQMFYELVGYFVNFVVVRTPKLNATLSFIDYLSAVKTNMLDAFAHGSTPFDEVVKIVQPERNDSQTTPLANVILVLQNTPMPTLTNEKFSIELLSQHNGSAKFDLLFNFYEDQNGLTGILEYRARMFDEKVMQELIDAFTTLTRNVIADKTKTLEQFVLLSSKAQHQCINFHTAQQIELTLTETPIQRFRRIALQYPKQIALVHHDKTLTYESLEIASNQLANCLYQSGIDAGSLVAVSMPVSFELITTILAILKVGAAYLPIDSTTPEDRFNYYLNHSQIDTLIVDDQSHLYASCKEVKKLIDLSTIKSDLTRLPPIFEAQSKMDDLIYVIYTSGSTGKPKGVMVSNRNVMALLTASTEACFQFNADDIWTLFHSYAFDFSVWEIWGALLFGGRLVLIDAELRSCTDKYYELLKTHRVTVLNQTPSAFYELINIDRMMPEKALSHLRYVIFGGAALSLPRLRPWLQKYGDALPKLINMYGITEITVHASYKRLLADEILHAPQSLIGYALPHLALFVLDSQMRCVPCGAIGEIYVGGTGVALGYLNSETLTQERFIEIPQLFNGKFYKTGDLARYLSPTELEYISRADRQVKIRGFRIELSEIEQSILAHPLIQQVLVLNIDNQEQQALVAYVSVDPDCFPEEESSPNDVENVSVISEQISDWQNAFDFNYTRDEDIIDDPLFNISGWHSAISKLPLPKGMMHEWLTGIVQVLQQFPYQSVLEVGCGSGMILGRLAPGAQRYTATDFSKEALNYVATHVLPVIETNHYVRLIHAPAHDFSLLGDEHPDLVILNSIVQYFPSVTYFIRVLSQAVERMSSGYIMIGDVRSLELAPLMYADTALFQLPAGVDNRTVNDWIELSIAQENELIFSHLFFFTLQQYFPKISHVEVRAHKGHLCDELNLYRYDVIIAINLQPACDATAFQVVNGMRFSLRTLESFLNTIPQNPVCIKKILNGRLLDKLKSHPLKAFDSLALPDETMQLSGIDPNDLAILCQRLGLHYELCLNETSPLYFDLMITKLPMPIYPFLAEDRLLENISSLFSHPAHNKIKDKIRTEIESILRKKLPEYMIPAEFIFVDHIPLTQQGKINEKALPSPAIFFSLKTRLKSYVAPETEREQQIINAFESILKIRGIGRLDHFFDLGGHSLLVVRLMLLLQEKLGIHVNISAIMKHPTVVALSNYIDNQSLQNDEEKIDVDDMTLLPVTNLLDTKKLNGIQRSAPTAIFLTGATGYLGIHLLERLLTETTADIFCLVRADNEANGFKKLVTSLQQYRLDSTALDRILSRVHVICGDLSLPNFGLNLTQLDFLYARIDLILHNGANVNFMMPYASLRAPNVDSTKFLLRWSMEGHIPFHFVSSLYVFSQADVSDGEVFESQLSSAYHPLSLGYLKTKWVCEKLIDQVKHQGYPITNFRIGRISGSAHSGINQPYDFFWNFIRACLTIRKIPDIELEINLIPVDYVATLIAKVVASHQSSLDQYYHVLNRHPASLKMVKQILMQQYADLSIQSCSFGEWRNALKRAELSNQLDNTIVSLLPLLTTLSKDSNIAFNAENCIAVAKKFHLEMPDMSQELMSFYLKKEIETFQAKRFDTV